MAKWAELPNDLITLIANHVKVIEDFLAFDYVRLVSYYGGGGNRLAFWRPGNLNWTNIIAEWGEITHISYFKGQFYSVSWSGRVWVIDVIGPKLIKPHLLVQLEDDMWREHHTIQLYLVELCGALLLVIRFANYDDVAYPEGAYKTLKFKVFELDVIESSTSTPQVFLGVCYWLVDEWYNLEPNYHMSKDRLDILAQILGLANCFILQLEVRVEIIARMAGTEEIWGLTILKMERLELFIPDYL
ncbi:hypothetical protein CQW23_00393 [Capsicum baccatum]|uniref:KIB1-4 beta-propeller domain-containing protein n=1 Tax=Capsicum baccatum TaxID=33114 RepID=A0A2G2XKL6_CAPBA|nr:hypothetical protein CQW23_00393 [Capsicum baccatum]